MKKTLILAALTAIVFTGCVSVPKTVVQFDKVKISSGKNVSFTSATATVSNGVPIVSIQGYSSTNDPAVLRIVTQAQAELTKNYLATMNNLAELGKALAK